ncbi:GFA family protein [Noviherbaspirillum malthae]|uniref:GFA family protein n=1 Tax=Noviherbaspirillum malthae TaxID=1260987 RepID=UPI00189077FD|nr:GFA family protein [Noviherbaspirillum malthae]
MTKDYPGGCACGAVRFQCSAAPLAMYNCHCRSCQLASGGACAPLLVVPGQALRIAGHPKRHRPQRANGNHATRLFCPECGTPLLALPDNNPAVVLVHAAALDFPDGFKPVADIWTVDALPWAHMDRHIPKMFKSPPILEPEDEVTL